MNKIEQLLDKENHEKAIYMSDFLRVMIDILNENHEEIKEYTKLQEVS